MTISCSITATERYDELMLYFSINTQLRSFVCTYIQGAYVSQDVASEALDLDEISDFSKTVYQTGV